MLGTFKQRINLALALRKGGRHKPISNINSDYIPHYCYILDKSAEGAAALGAAKQINDGGLANRLGDKTVLNWQKSPYPYAIVFGSWGFTGGTTIASKNLQNLLDDDLPKIMAILKTKGGLCSFVVATDGSVIAQIQSVLSKLQPQEF